MTYAITIDPTKTRTAGSLFRADFTGYIQGKPNDTVNLLDTHLSSAFIKAGEVLPMWQGAPIHAVIKASATDKFGLTISRATTVAAIDGFCVQTLNNHAIQTTSSPVPLMMSGWSANYVRRGSKVQVPLPIDPALISSLYAKKIDMSEVDLTIDLDLTSDTYGHVIAKGVSDTNLATLGMKIIDLNYNSSKIIVRDNDAVDWDANTAFKWNNEGSTIVLEI